MPDYIEITDNEIDYDRFMSNSRSTTSKKELMANGGEILKKIAQYEEKEVHQFLISKSNDLDIKAITVKDYNYSEFGGLDLSLGLSDNISFKYMHNPSEGLAVSKKMGGYQNLILRVLFMNLFSSIFRYNKIVYRKGKALELEPKGFGLNISKEYVNVEITFLDQVEYRGLCTLTEYFAKETKKDYDLKLIDGYDTKVIFQNMNVSEKELKVFSKFYKNCNSSNFTDYALYLYNYFNKSIKSIEMMYGVLVVKGTNKEENTIYTTLKEEELTEGLRELLNKNKIR